MTAIDHFRCSLTPEVSINRMINGLWQVSGSHGAIDPQKAIGAMFHYTAAGLNTWDLADHYDGAEELINKFQHELSLAFPTSIPHQPTICIKWFPRPGAMTRPIVEAQIDRSLQQMQINQIDLLQFHWWDYRDTRYLNALKQLADIQASGKIKALALTNFDTEHLQLVLDEGIPIVANQVQFSILDRRPLTQMTQFCLEQNIKLLTYGTLGGGFFTDRFLNSPEPQWLQLTTASLRKYRNMINAWGSWRLFQELLNTLKTIADKHDVTLANVAMRYVLEQPAVAALIVGTRLGIREHISENLNIFDFHLDPEDHQQIATIHAKGNNLFQTIGDCGDEYRNHS